MNDTDQLLTADELAELLRVRPSTIRLWTREGLIPAVRIGTKVIRFDATDVLATLRRRAREGLGASGEGGPLHD